MTAHPINLASNPFSGSEGVSVVPTLVHTAGTWRDETAASLQRHSRVSARACCSPECACLVCFT